MNDVAATAEKILDAAQSMTQAVGYNGLSFRELAKAVGIKSASVHYYYPSKAQLGAAIARRYTDRLSAALAEIDRRKASPANAIASYAGFLHMTLEQDGKMCLCGMLAAEIDATPPEVRSEVRRFIELNVDWLANTLARASGKSAKNATVRDHARALFAALEGAMLVARGSGDAASFDAMTARLKRAGMFSC